MNHLNDILKLSLSERILAVETIWDSIANDSAADDAPLSDRTKALLDKRLRSHLANPSEGSTWEEVKARLFQK